MLSSFLGSRRIAVLLAIASFLFLAGSAALWFRSRGTPHPAPWPPRWSFPALSQVVEALNIENAAVYGASADATVYALALPTGEVIWQQPLAMPSYAPPIVKYGLVFIGSNKPAFYALDALTGAPVWRIATSAPVSQAAAFRRGLVFFADDSGLVMAVEALSGKVVWRFQGKGPASAPCAIAERLFVAAVGRLYCLAQSTGELRWDLQTGNSTLCSPATNGEAVFIGGAEGQLLALRVSDGSRLWSTPIGEDVEMPPWVEGEKVIVAAGNWLVCLETASGRVLWEHRLKGRITTPPGGDGHHIFVATDRGILYVLNTRTGRPLWKHQVGDIISGRINSNYGSLFFGTWGGQLRAVPLPTGL